ncbi:MAG: peroxiredoxin [Oscillospiraceae bacterium]|nr:peroxiredoxin [Oscillospiraceae bacterium]
MLQAGDRAPAFSLPDQEGRLRSMKEFIGRKFVIYFYSKDNTPGCTRQACSFRDLYGEFRALGVPVVGVSRDSVKSHAGFAAKQELPFVLLSDPELQAITAYDVWQEKKLYGKVSMGVVRTAYLVGEDGVILKAFPRAKPDTNAEEILGFLKTLA